jgi:hypothetical protein
LEEYLPALRPPLAAQLIDLADEIAYNTADLDDAVAAGLLRPRAWRLSRRNRNGQSRFEAIPAPAGYIPRRHCGKSASGRPP